MRWAIRLLVLSVTVALAAVACSGGGSEAPAPETDTGPDVELPDLAGRTVTVAVDNAQLPFSYIDGETGRPGGWDYDAIDEVCARVGCIPDYRTVPREAMIDAVASGEVDLAGGGLEVTDDRVEFSDAAEPTSPDASVPIDRLAFAFQAGSELVDPFNAALREMADDGTIEALSEQYFTDAFTITDDDIALPG